MSGHSRDATSGHSLLVATCRRLDIASIADGGGAAALPVGSVTHIAVPALGVGGPGHWGWPAASADRHAPPHREKTSESVDHMPIGGVAKSGLQSVVVRACTPPGSRIPCPTHASKCTYASVTGSPAVAPGWKNLSTSARLERTRRTAFQPTAFPMSATWSRLVKNVIPRSARLWLWRRLHGAIFTGDYDSWAAA